ncbi:hypothetical protein FYK55_07860 [Roseiconus nitratireducens]|uniref:Uncharacterized protein n=1 Tax=Roseiconus nitratireducens TaxID=2605748 RepID=A0A5M6DJS5_9BACT|nr:hypothetical protein FYK55_07860 [Roseiconus nitratireducens]
MAQTNLAHDWGDADPKILSVRSLFADCDVSANLKNPAGQWRSICRGVWRGCPRQMAVMPSPDGGDAACFTLLLLR